MSISATNIPNITEATVTVDGTNVEDQSVSVAVDGNEYELAELAALNGDTFAKVGKKSPTNIVITSIYTDGETSDLWDVLDAKHGTDVAVVMTPKSGGGYFTIDGVLYRLDPPSLNEGGDILYTWGVSGSLDRTP